MSLLLLAAASLAAEARAGCTTDMDCKGDRICEEGVCVSPPAGTAAAAAAAGPVGAATTPSASLTELQRADLGSARGKAVVGYIGAGSTLLFGTASLATYEELGPALTFGSASLLSAAVTAPIAASGGIRARRTARAAGMAPPSRALPIVSWIGYGAAMFNGMALIALGAAEAEPPPPLIASTVLLGVVSTLGMAIDAQVSASHVQNTLHTRHATAPSSGPTVTVAPVVALGPRGDARVGLTGSF